MNRAERRRRERQGLGKDVKDPVYTVKRSDLDQAKKEAAQNAIDAAFILMLGLPVMVLHDKYEWGGKKRLPEFTEHVLDLYDSFNRDFFTLDEVLKAIKKEAGVDIELMMKKRKNNGR